MTAIERTSTYRQRPTPQRVVGDQVVVARPSDGAAIALGTTTAEIWLLLTERRELDELVDLLGDRHAALPADERRRGLVQILDRLDDEGIVERSPA